MHNGKLYRDILLPVDYKNIILVIFFLICVIAFKISQHDKTKNTETLDLLHAIFKGGKNTVQIIVKPLKIITLMKIATSILE